MVIRSPRSLQAAVAAGSALLTVAALGFAGAHVSASESHIAPPAHGPKVLPSNQPSSFGHIVVAVVLGSSGTVGSDVLGPYDVFASSPDFSVYTVAAKSAPAPIDGGPAIAHVHVPGHQIGQSPAARRRRRPGSRRPRRPRGNGNAQVDRGAGRAWGPHPGRLQRL
jgi:hypothetical protein